MQPSFPPSSHQPLAKQHVFFFFFYPGLPAGRRRLGRASGGRLPPPRRRGGSGGAVHGLLRLHVPGRVQDRAGRPGGGAPVGPSHLRQPHPPPLPRLLRAGLRRLAAAGHLRRDGVGEGRAAQQRVGARLRGRGRRQGSPRGRLPRRRLLRRHPRHRRRDLGRAVRRARVERVAGEAGQLHVQQSRRREPTRPLRRPGRAQSQVPERHARRHHRPRCPLRWPHFWPCAVPVRHGPAVQLQRDEPARPIPRRDIPSLPVPEMPEERRRDVPERPRPDHTRQLRQELLHKPRGEPRLPTVRPGAQVGPRCGGDDGANRR
ncbi:hypothetical protein ACQJBY_066031 [Aegilops geniculata]